MLDVYSGQPISMTIEKSRILLESYQIKQAAIVKESKANKEPRILEDLDVGFMQHPVGSHMTYNIPLINVMTQNLTEHFEDYSIDYADVCFVAQGSSGCIIAALIAAKIAGSIIWDIKKPGQKSHSHHGYCAPVNTKYMVFVDDFISSGKTFHRCYDEVKKYKRTINCIAVTGRVSWTLFEDHPVDTIICQEYNEQLY